MSDSPVLAADFEKKLDDVRKKREIDESRIRELAGEQTRIENLIRAEPPQEAVLANEGEIDELKRLVGADAKLQSESIRADTRRSEEEGKARDIFRELTGTTAWDQMTVLRLRLEDERRITELANERAAVLQDVTNCAEAVRRANEDLRIAVAKQVGAAAPTDPAPWLAAVESISALGLVETQAQVRKSEAAAEEVRLRGDFARFQPPVPCVWTEAVSAQVPLPEAVTRFRKEFDNAQRAVVHASEEFDQIDRDMSAMREQLVDTVGAEPVPTVNDLSGGAGIATVVCS